MTTHPVSTDRRTVNKHLVEAFIQALFTAGDLDAVDRFVDAACVNHDPPFPGAPEGPDGWRHAATEIRRALPDWHSNVEQLVAEDDLVVERFTASGTHQGEFFGVPGTGKTLVMPGINIFRIRGDKIVERWGRLDQFGLLRQLGLVPE